MTLNELLYEVLIAGSCSEVSEQSSRGLTLYAVRRAIAAGTKKNGHAVSVTVSPAQKRA